MQKPTTQWEIHHSLKRYYQKVTEKIILLLQEAIKHNGSAIVGLSGGTTPGPIYAQLAQTKSATTIAWEKVFLIWVDERFVSQDSAESNYKLVQDTLLSSNMVPEQNIYPIPIHLQNPQKILQTYEQQLQELFRITGRSKPFIDIVILGMGTDGHTASLFPGMKELTMLETYNWVITPYVKNLQSYRVSLTPKLLNTAKIVLILVTGEKKALLVKKILHGHNEPPYPIELIRPENGKIMWELDMEAAKELA